MLPDRTVAKRNLKELKKRKRAFYLSLILPGLGQFLTGRRVSGIAFSTIFFFPFYYLYLIGFEPNYGTATFLLSQALFYYLQLKDALKGRERETSPCEDECPAKVNIPSFMAACEEGEIEKGWGVFMNFSPFPFTLGEICHAPCEEKCGVLVERPLRIKEVHRELAKEFLNSLEEIKKREPFFTRLNRKVAIVGGGIAGITAAYYLASVGLKVDLFEKEEKLGGTLNFVPDFKLNKELFQKEILLATSFKNLRIFTGKEVKEIPRNHYDAVIVAVGAQREKKLDIPVEGKVNLIYPLSFLKNPPELKGKRVVVIGAGDTAFDVARLTVRLKGEAVVFYRGEEEKIKAQKKEINAALKEGVKIYTNCIPEKVANNTVKFSCKEVTFDYLVPAIGFEKDEKTIEELIKSYPEAIVAGDAKCGMSNAALASYSGKEAAFQVLKRLKLTERGWFTLDLYIKKPPKGKTGKNVFVTSESALCQHCGEKVRS